MLKGLLSFAGYSGHLRTVVWSLGTAHRELPSRSCGTGRRRSNWITWYVIFKFVQADAPTVKDRPELMSG